MSYFMIEEMGGYRPIITTKNPTKLENHFKRQ